MEWISLRGISVYGMDKMMDRGSLQPDTER